jgi:DNA-binding SARP family transcriptional activator
VEFRILGPLEVAREGRTLPPAAHKPWALLGILLLHRGQAVPLERLVDELWGERPPATAAKILQVYISQLRKLLGEGVLETRGRGYALLIEREQVDAGRFERMLDEGTEHLAGERVREAAAVLSDAIGLWRGPALADFACEPWAQAEIARLEDLRLAAIEERIDADLALGRHRKLIAELEGLVDRHPTRERPCGQLMLALYRSGRQTDALEAFRQRRRTMVDQLGIEPSPALRELEAAILRHDPGLESPVRSPPPLLRRRRGGALIALGGGAVLLAALAAGVVSLVREADTPVGGALKPLSASLCSPMTYAAGAHPRYLVVSDQTLQGPNGVLGNQITAAVEFVLRENRFTAGPYAVAYQACDSEDYAEDSNKGCEVKARQYARHPAVLGVVGPLSSVCAYGVIPVANAARPGPLALVSPSNTQVTLTRPAPAGAPDEPERFYPKGVRNYVRVIAADDFQFAANAMLARQLGVKRAFVLTGDEFFAETAEAFHAAAEKLALPVVGSASWIESDDYRALAQEVRRARADAVFLAGAPPDDGAKLLRELRAVLARKVRLLAPDGFSDPDLAANVGSASEGMYISVPGVDPKALTGSGRELVERLREAVGEPHPFAVSAAQATQMLLDAIGRSDGTRRSVVDELFATEVRGGLLGDFSVTSTGDTTANRVTIYRIEGGERRVDRVLTPPLSLVVPR